MVTQSIVCEFCYERTPLDAESITELEKLIPSSKMPAASSKYAEPTASKYDHKPEPKTYTAARNPPPDYSYDKTANRPYDRTDRSRVGAGNSDVFSGIPFKKQCGDHPDE